MGSFTKSLLSLVLSALFWLGDRIWGDRVFAAIKPMIPDWIIAGVRLDAIADVAFSYLPPLGLAALGIYFFISGNRHLRRIESGRVAATAQPSQNELQKVTSAFDNAAKNLAESMSKAVARVIGTDFSNSRSLRGQVQHNLYTNGRTVTVGPDDKQFTLRFSPAGSDCMHMYRDQLTALARVRGRNPGDVIKIEDYQKVAESFTIAIGERFIGMNKLGQFIQGKIIEVKYDGRNGADHHEITFDYEIPTARSGQMVAI
jgi:hypothetical protein